MVDSNSNKTDSKNLKLKAVSSAGWGFLDKGSNVVVQFVVGIVLARLLPPSDFGLIGLGMIVIGFGQIFINLGLGPSLIQKQDISERHIRVVLTTSGIAGILFAVVVYLSAPFAALILGSESVEPIVRALSIIFVVGGLQIPSLALLQKRLDFQHIFYVSIAKSIFYGIITISLALSGFGVWSLVIGSIIQRFVSLTGCYWYVRHSLKPLFAKKEIMDLAYFGSGETLSGVFNYFALQGDYFMIGRILGTEALGLYSKAYSLMVQPTKRFVSVLSNVLFPAASKIQDDSTKLKNVFIKTMRTIAFIIAPLCTLLIILAPELIIGLYGEKWAGTIVPLQILGAFGIFRAMYNTAAVFLKAKGWVYRIFISQIIYGSSVLILVWIGAKFFSLSGAAWAVGFSIFVMWSLMMEFNCRAILINRIEIVKALVPGLIIAISMGLPLLLIRSSIVPFISSHLVLLFLLLVIGLVLTVAIIFILPQRVLSYLPAEIINIMKEYLPEALRENCDKVLILLK